MVVIRVLARVLWLPIKLALEIVGLAFRAGRTAGRAPVRVGVAATRRLGWRRIALLKVGFIAGLLLAPVPGRVLRAKLVGLVRPSAAPDAGLADRVSFELSHAPRTWHLPQPAVTVDEAAGVTLRGTVPHEDAREHLVAAARAVPGVDHVHDDLVVEAPDASAGADIADATGADGASAS